MGDEVSIGPVDDPCVHVRDLDEGGDLRVSGAAIDPDHVRHPPVVAVLNDHCHPRTDVEKDRICHGRNDATGMVIRHPS